MEQLAKKWQNTKILHLSIIIPQRMLAFSHSLEPGDHVIRWEMLPIVYPIQIHGIVLEAGEDYVTIVDFGLTSYQEEVVQEEEESKL